MKKAQEPVPPITFWPQAVVQLFVLLGLFWVATSQFKFLESVSARIIVIVEEGALNMTLLVWLAMVFLIGEVTARQSQNLAARIFPDHFGAFIGTSLAISIPVLYTAFVVVQCVLFFIITGRYPLWEGPQMSQSFALVWRSDWGWAIVLLFGESLRWILYRKPMRKWHNEMWLRKQPAAEVMEKA